MTLADGVQPQVRRRPASWWQGDLDHTRPALPRAEAVTLAEISSAAARIEAWAGRAEIVAEAQDLANRRSAIAECVHHTRRDVGGGSRGKFSARHSPSRRIEPTTFGRVAASTSRGRKRGQPARAHSPRWQDVGMTWDPPTPDATPVDPAESKSWSSRRWLFLVILPIVVIGLVMNAQESEPKSGPDQYRREVVDTLARQRDCASLQARFDDWADGGFTDSIEYADAAMRRIGCYG